MILPFHLPTVPSKIVRLWTMARDDGIWCFVFFTDGVFTYLVVDIVLD